MKRILSLILAGLTALSLPSCAFLNFPNEPPVQCTSHRDADDDGKCDTCEEPFEDGGEIPDDGPTVDEQPDLTPVCTHRDMNADGFCDDCAEKFPDCTAESHRDLDDDGKCDGCSRFFDDGNEASGEPLPDVQLGKNYTAAISVYKGTVNDLSPIIEDYLALDGALWESDSTAIASVDNGVVTANGYGKTAIRIEDAKGNKCNITLTVRVYVNQSGFNITPTDDQTVYKVSTEREANALVDTAITNHKSRVILDFSAFGNDYRPFADFDFKYEYGNHVSITKKYYESKPQILYVEFKYNANAASTYTEPTPATTYESVDNANMLLRAEARKNSPYARPDDFSDFPIYKSNRGTVNVHNSEELWLALEHNYLPVFPTKYTKAESFFEEAKMILREIITEDMTDYEKVLAIFDYLVNEVEYDYATFSNPDSSDPISDVCYYLEGVFERGVAVCDGKSKAFVLFCRIEGIECLRDFGSSNTGGVGHAWNYVKLDGKWYLVDTTNADTAQSASTNIGSFFEKNVEITVYEAFLTRLSYHSYKYEYSGIHSEIFAAAGTDISQKFINAAPKGAEYDFKVGSDREFELLLTDLFLAEPDECVLILALSSSVGWNLVLDDVIDELGVNVEYAAYNSTMCGLPICYLLIKN